MKYNKHFKYKIIAALVVLVILIILVKLAYNISFREKLSEVNDIYMSDRVLLEDEIRDYIVQVAKINKSDELLSKQFSKGNQIVGKDPRNGLVIELITPCGDICPTYAHSYLIYKDIPEDECLLVGGKIGGYSSGWGGFNFCEVVSP